MGVDQFIYEPQLQTITGLTADQMSFKTWFNTLKMPFTSSHTRKVKLHNEAAKVIFLPQRQSTHIITGGSSSTF